MKNISMQIFFIFGAGWKEKYGRRGRHEERKALGASGDLGNFADAAARRRGLGVSGVFRGGLASFIFFKEIFLTDFEN